MSLRSARSVFSCPGAAVLGFVLNGVASAGQPAKDGDVPATPPAAAQGIAVVELFTSEGCSSCPPADALLSKLIARSGQDGTSVFALAFHVDYWNNLGWKDRFAQPAFTERQKAYARALHSELYTPQMVVNGTDEFVGSDERAAEKAIGRALAAAPACSIAVTPKLDAQKGLVVLECRLEPAAPGAVVNAALVESGLSSEVKSGENSGRRLVHDGVVRAFVSGSAGDGKGAGLELQLPVAAESEQAKPAGSGAAAPPARTRIIVFVQDRGTMRVLGASAVATPTP